MRLRGKLAGLALVIGILGCESEDPQAFASLPIELPHAAHATPFDGKDCVSLAIVPSALGGGALIDAAIVAGAGKFELATYVKAQGAKEGREELTKALVAVLKEQAAMREKPGKASGVVSEAPVLVYADRRVGAESFLLALAACARAGLYKIHVRVADPANAAAAAGVPGPVLRCWLPQDRGLGSLPSAAALRKLNIALVKNSGGAECKITDAPLIVNDDLTDVLGGEKTDDVRPAPKRVALAADVSLLTEEIARAKRAFEDELRKLAADGVEIPRDASEKGMPVWLDPAADVLFQDLVTVLDVCIGCGIKAIEFCTPERW
jgi:biopolymer transport protein ExbD